MIKRLEAKYIDDVAVAHKLAWQKAFRGVLSDMLLDALTDNEFIDSWNTIVTRLERTNLVKVTEEDKAVGFVSFGPPYDEQEAIGSEVYGIYVHPDHWNNKVGYELIMTAIEELTKKDGYNGVILWTMSKSQRSRRFYEKVGFQRTDEKRTSRRKSESFEEIKYQYADVKKVLSVNVVYLLKKGNLSEEQLAEVAQASVAFVRKVKEHK